MAKQNTTPNEGWDLPTAQTGSSDEWGNPQQSAPTQHFPQQSAYQQPQPQYQYPQGQYQQQYAPAPAEQKRGTNGWLIALIVLLLAALVGLAAWLAGSGKLSGSDAKEPATSTVVETQIATQQQQQQQEAPAPAAPAPQQTSYSYSNYAANTSVTSNSFAANVYSAFIDAYASSGTPNVTVSAYSPATGHTYVMSCSGGATVYCSGGNNAQVKIW